MNYHQSIVAVLVNLCSTYFNKGNNDNWMAGKGTDRENMKKDKSWWKQTSRWPNLRISWRKHAPRPQGHITHVIQLAGAWASGVVRGKRKATRGKEKLGSRDWERERGRGGEGKRERASCSSDAISLVCVCVCVSQFFSPLTSPSLAHVSFPDPTVSFPCLAHLSTSHPFLDQNILSVRSYVHHLYFLHTLVHTSFKFNIRAYTI